MYHPEFGEYDEKESCKVCGLPDNCGDCTHEDSHGRFVAIVRDSDGIIFDRTYNWQSAQSYAQEGYQVTAIRASSHIMDIEASQRLYEYEKRIHDDCFNPDNYKDAA